MSFDTLPDHSRLWLLAMEHPPAPEALARLEQGLGDLLAQWRHKGQVYQGACAVLQGQIIAIAEPTLASAPSGCAIDGMLRRIHTLVTQLPMTLVDPAQSVLVRLEGTLRPIPKLTLPQAVDDGTLTPSTPVIDLALYTLSDLRAGKLETPLSSTWIARKFNLPTPI